MISFCSCAGLSGICSLGGRARPCITYFFFPAVRPSVRPLMQHAPLKSSSSVVAAVAAAAASRIYGFSDERSVRFGPLLRVYFVNEFSAYENGPYFKYLDELEEGMQARARPTTSTANSSPLVSAINCSNFKDPRKCWTGEEEADST